MNPSSLRQPLLTLSVLSYARFFELRRGQHDMDALTKSLQDALDMDTPANGWSLAWGPATYRRPYVLFDDAMMFVVQAPPALWQDRPVYAVVVRGTNPVAGWDWLFQDFWSDLLLEWGWGPYYQAQPTVAQCVRHTERPAISMSTHLGLSLLQNLRGEEHGPFAFGLRDLLMDGLSTIIQAVEAQIDQKLQEIRQKVRELLAKLYTRYAAVTGEDPEAAFARWLALWQSDTWRAILALLREAANIINRHVQFDLLGFIEEDSALEQGAGEGVTLLDFLQGVAEGGKAEVWVTGHSKGGALAPTLATWLADCQGPDAPADYRWDPANNVTLGSWAYAGPTPGNQAFADHANRLLAGRAFRVANPYDLVPCAWRPDTLRQGPRLYTPPLPTNAGLEALVGVVARITGGMAYAHVGRDVSGDGWSLSKHPLTVPTEMIHAHLQGYLEHEGLAEVLDWKALIGVMT